jgi:hypothetical protein
VFQVLQGCPQPPRRAPMGKPMADSGGKLPRPRSSLYRVALYIVDQTLQGERGGHDQELIPQQYACESATQNFMALL